MSFFNSKEEVIDIQLTKYGRHLLMSGKFDPKYYAFFDEDIVYDQGTKELQNDIQKRILEETPYPKLNYTYDKVNDNVIKLEDIKDNSKNIGIPLTATDDSIKYFPSFDISFKKGQIDYIHLSSSFEYDKFGSEIVPQIYLKPETVSIVIDDNYYGYVEQQKEVYGIKNYFPVEKANDNTFIRIEIPSIILNVLEHNVEDIEQNLELEFHKITESDDMYTDEILGLPSELISDEDMYIKDNLLMDVPYQPQYMKQVFSTSKIDSSNYTQKDSNMLQYYFSIILDGDEMQEQQDISNERLYIYGKDMLEITPKGDKC